MVAELLQTAGGTKPSLCLITRRMPFRNCERAARAPIRKIKKYFLDNRRPS